MSRAPEHYYISASTGRVTVKGDTQQVATLGAEGYFKTLLSLPPQRCLDLLYIAAGVYVVDRIKKRSKNLQNENGIRRLSLSLEVRDPKFWKQPKVKGLLRNVLAFLTDDDWDIRFSGQSRVSPHQDFLPLPGDFQPKSVALYSGGLDSAAGLVSRFLEHSNDFLLVTVGHQSGIHRRVRGQLNRLAKVLDGVRDNRFNYRHSTLTTYLEGGKSRRLRIQEKSQRSRSFLFCAAASVAAHAYKISKVEVFENGIGAINLPVMTGMLGSGLSTRGAHPTFLRLMSSLASLVAEKPIKFVLPFEDMTKAEVLRNVKEVAGLAAWVNESRSCIHSAIRAAGKTHCGTCPACIERRQAFKVADVAEHLENYQGDIFVCPPSSQEDYDYFRLYQLDAINWIDGSENVWRRMENHLRLTDVDKDRCKKAVQVQMRHAKEVCKTYGSEFLRYRNGNAERSEAL